MNRKRGYLYILLAAMIYSTTEVALKGLGGVFAPCRSRSSACSSARSFCCPSLLQPAAERHSPHPLRLELLCPARLSDGHAAHVAAPDGRAAHGRLGDLHHLLRQPRLCPRRRAPDPARAAETEPPHCHRRRADRHPLHSQPREARGQSARLRGDPHGDRSLRHVRHTLQAAHPAARRTGHHDLQHGPRRTGAGSRCCCSVTSPPSARSTAVSGLDIFADVPFFAGFTLRSALLLCYVGIFCAAFGFLLTAKITEYTSATEASFVYLIKPVLATLLAVVCFRETISVSRMIGLVFLPRRLAVRQRAVLREMRRDAVTARPPR